MAGDMGHPKGGTRIKTGTIVIVASIVFIAIAVGSAGSGYIKTLSDAIKVKDGQIAQLLQERDGLAKDLEDTHEGHHGNTKELQQKVGALRKEVDLTKEQLERKEGMIEKNKQAAKKLATVLTKVRDQLQKTEEEAADLRKQVQVVPAEDCDEALAKKDTALAALVRERDKTDMVLEKLRAALDAKDSEITAVTREMENNAGQMQKLKLWREAAEEELKRRHGTASQIWAASISDKSSKCPKPIPQVVGAGELGALVNREGKRVGVELGVTEGLVNAVMAEWHVASSYFVIDTAVSSLRPADKARHDKEMVAHLALVSPNVHFVSERTLTALGQFGDNSIDLLFYTDAKHATGDEIDAVVSVLDAVWPKMLPGGLVVGGFEPAGAADAGVHGEDMPASWQAAMKFGKAVGRQPMFGLHEHSWAIRK